MHVVHTAALPPNHGRMSRAISGCTRKSRNEDRKIVDRVDHSMSFGGRPSIQAAMAAAVSASRPK